MKYVMTYRAVEDFLPLAQHHYPAHSARVEEFARRGDLLMVGTFDEPMNGEAMGVFTTREAAEEFIAGDPFVVNGVVASWAVRPWNEVLQP
ncbi:YciI family protein [Geodermatophilus sp. SYSU D00779]